LKITNFTLLIIFVLGINSFCHSQELKLKISSKDSLENTILSKINYSKEKLTISSIKNELDSISKNISLLGFLNAEIIATIKNDSIYLTEYKLNNQIKEIEINIKINKLNNEFLKINDFLVQNNKIKIPYKQLKTFINTISHFYEEKGFSFVKVKLTNHQIKNSILSADLIIQNKKLRTINHFLINGYKKFPKKFIKFNLNKSKNKKFNKAVLTDIYNQINTIPFITQIKKPEVLFLKDSTLIYIYLKKNKASMFDGLIGFSTNNESKLVFNGHLDLTLNNVFNKGELIEFSWKSNEKENKYLDLKFDIPYIFNTRINPKIDFSIYSQDSSYVNILTKATLNYRLNNKHKIGLISSIEKSNSLLKNDIQNILDYKTDLYGVAYQYKENSTDFFYKNKQHINFTVIYGTKNINNNKTNKTEILSDLNYLIELNKRFTINLNNYTAINISDNILENELYKIGGTNSIRGFTEKSITSSKYSIFTSDINYKLNKNTYLYTILDYSQTYNQKFNSLISLGIGYKTKLKSSILNINYTIGKTQDNSFDLKKALLNIGFINYF
jgi:hypothetical protein